MVASGALHASALSLLKKHVTPENAGELLELCTHRSARQVEALLAARFPQPDVRDLVRRLPARAAVTPDVGCSMPQASLAGPSHERDTAPLVLRDSSTGLEKTASDSTSRLGSAELSKAAIAPLSSGPSVRMQAPKSGRIEPLSAGRGRFSSMRPCG